ncbi:TetR/AcrR family transcriptional regulator [Cupriavidus basilensis]|uniref:TetR/AcrR family transcriptional regulator n=1 Tax=Cupriavidus basilensis TaxID=68895 RepID=UPI0020A69A5B|nr:TetR/AcrR family transcriptional regulator [Cupriavidus basilensis]MCP3020548.1 TetR/AcrR family transcriptional regulator [Cupriavidus basilensis]MDR3382721.1 helix-turn-helix domain containing protein [Cupriavidus basilensis]
MPAATEPPKRRQPSQQRAQHTVQAILQAAAQLFAEHEMRAQPEPTTEQIAALAGVSVGSLYQYFADRAAIGRTLIEQQREAALVALETMLAERLAAMPAAAGLAEPQAARAALRAYVQAYVLSFGGYDAHSRALARLAWRHDRDEDAVAALRLASERIGAQLQALGMSALRLPAPAQMFALTRALFGVVRSAALERSPLLGSPALEDELVRLCWSLLQREPDAG